MYFQCCKYFDFVDLMWPLGVPGSPWVVSEVLAGGGGAQGEMIASGGPEGQGAAPRGGQESSNDQMRVLN